MNAKALLALIDECGMIELVNRSGRDSDGWIQETILRALRLLAAAEANGGERSQLIEELRTEADLCRNETADDVADLLDDAASSLVAISAMANALKDERDALKRHAEAMAEVLGWLNRLGGLGYDKHARIEAALDAYRAEFKGE